MKVEKETLDPQVLGFSLHDIDTPIYVFLLPFDLCVLINNNNDLFPRG